MALCGSQNCGCAITSSTLSVTGSGTGADPWNVELSTVGTVHVPLSFANAAARDVVIPSPVEGDLAYTEDNNTWWFHNGTEWVSVSGGAAISYTPTMDTTGLSTSNGSTGTQVGWYSQVRDLVYAQFVFTFGGTGITQGTGTLSISLPVTAKTISGSTIIPRGWVEVMDATGPTYRDFQPFFTTTTVFDLRTLSTTSFSAKAAIQVDTGLVTFAAGDQIVGWVLYHAA